MWLGPAAVLTAAAIGFYAILYWDVTSRARESYREAERYMDWNRHPDEKRAYYDADFTAQKQKIERLAARGKISAAERDDRLEAAAFERDFHEQESSLKYAYQWYRDTYELFSPPESKWVRMARQKAPEALAAWKDELREKKIPFQETTFQ